MQICPGEDTEEGDQALKSPALDSNCDPNFPGCVILGNFLNFSNPQFPHLWNEDSNTHFKRLPWELTETPYMVCLASGWHL